MEQEVFEQEQETIEINISRHDFDQAKEQLKEFAEQIGEELYFDRVRTHEDFFGFEFAEHGVTGNEFNTLVEQIQNYFSKFYERQQKMVEEFGQVYIALEALDKDYIQAILSSVAAIDHTNKKIIREQERLQKTIENQKATLVALKQFKEKLNEENSKNLVIKITHIDYDPKGADKNNESIALSIFNKNKDISSIDFSKQWGILVFDRTENYQSLDLEELENSKGKGRKSQENTRKGTSKY